MRIPPLIDALARSLMAGSPTAEEAHARAVLTLGRNWRWLRPLVRRFAERFADGVRPRHRDVAEFLLNDDEFLLVRQKYGKKIYIAQWIAEPQGMQPVDAALLWDVPSIDTVGDLAEWLEIGVAELEWFADLKGFGYKFRNPKLRHYCYRVLDKRSGGVRLIESPKSALKGLQRRVLSEILDRVPPHSSVHGFVKGRSIASFASPHAGKHVVLRLDLQEFFPSFCAARVQAMFRTLGYPDGVASRLAGLCTNSVPADVWDRSVGFEVRQMYARPHLPQGAPTSPALANIMSYRLDNRLLGLAKSADAAYTRYADDLAFSGGEDFARGAARFALHAAAVALEEGFAVNHRKTRIMRRGVRQHVAGLVVNDKPALARRELELIEAILTNCVRHGPETQNRDNHRDFRAHLEGRVGFVEMIDRLKGRRLRTLLERIEWN